MASFLAVDWDETELRYARAEIVKRKVTVSAIGSIPLERAADGDSESSESRVDWGESLAAALREQKLGKPRLLLGMPRRDVELLYLELPPAKDDELPELVANQALSETPTLDENWGLDFLPTSDDPASPRKVTVVAASPKTLAHIGQQASLAGLKTERILFRPFATTSLLNRLKAGEDLSCLLVNLVGNEVDLSVLEGGRNVLSRTIRLPDTADRTVDPARLLTEITRTLTVAPLTSADDSQDVRVYILGSQVEHQELVEELTVEAGLSSEAIDPFAALQVSESLLSPARGKFAALLGMLLDQAAGTHAVDFLHPRKSRPTTSRWRIGAIVGGAVAGLALLVFGHVWLTLSEIDATNREMFTRYKQMDPTMKKVAEQKKVIDAVAVWKGRDIVWLDELRDLSVRFPGARDAIVMRMNMRFSGRSGGLVDLQGLVRDPKVLANMEYQVRDEYRRVRSRRIQERSLGQDYTWMFETSIDVARRAPSKYVNLPDEVESVVSDVQAPPATELSEGREGVTP